VDIAAARRRSGRALNTWLAVLYRECALPLRDFVYPPLCLACDKKLDPGEEKVCARCWGSIPPISDTHPIWLEVAGNLRAQGFVGDLFARYLFEKEGTLQRIVHLLKYGGMTSIGELLGREAAKGMAARPEFLAGGALVPVPLHRVRERERGYNQAACICKGISAATGLPVDRTLLVRPRVTDSQTGLDRDERRKNVRGAFALHPKRRGGVEGRSFILVDDVITTGSTVNACAEVLLNAGAVRVLALSVALAA
jgi:ComF family protein